MRSHFTKGLLIGSLIGASVMMMKPDMVMKNSTRKRMMRSGRNFFRRSGDLIGDVVNLFR